MIVIVCIDLNHTVTQTSANWGVAAHRLGAYIIEGVKIAIECSGCSHCHFAIGSIDARGWWLIRCNSRAEVILVRPICFGVDVCLVFRCKRKI